MQTRAYVFHGSRAAVAVALLLAAVCGAQATDSYDGTNLTIPSLVIGNASYSNVVVKPGTILLVGSGAPVGSYDTYDPDNGELTIPSVVVGSTTHTNVLITVSKLISIGSASWIDTYNASSGQLRIPSGQAGNALYQNVLITPGSIVGVVGGMPAAFQDVYTPATRQVLIPAVQDGNQIYTNVTITVGSVLSLGGASRFDDAPVQGLCYSTSPSGSSSASPTNVSGQFLYDAGDIVSFWVDGSGGGCTGTSAASASSINLGQLIPTGNQTSVLALPGGLEAADTLTALNIGTSFLMNVSGLKVRAADAANLSQFIDSEGLSLPVSADGSPDNLFHGVQADTVLAGNSAAPAYVVPVAVNTSTTESALEIKTTDDLLATAAGMPGQPLSVSVPANGELKMSFTVAEYTCAVCANPSNVYTTESASFVYLDGHGNLAQFTSPGSTVVSESNLADETTVGTYTIDGNVLAKVGTGVNPSNGATYSYHQNVTENYLDGVTLIAGASFSKTFTSGAGNGKTFAEGSLAINSFLLQPLTLSVLAGHTITVPGCAPSMPQTLTFVGVGSGPSSVTETQSQACGSVLPLTFTNTSIPGVLKATDSSGFIAYFGLYGAGLEAGANLVYVQEAPGSGGSSNGAIQQWAIVGPILSVD